VPRKTFQTHRFASRGLGLVVQVPYLAALHVTSGFIFCGCSMCKYISTEKELALYRDSWSCCCECGLVSIHVCSKVASLITVWHLQNSVQGHAIDSANPVKFWNTVTEVGVLICMTYKCINGDRSGTVVKVLCYKSEGCWFDSRWCHWNFPLT
jgi:hypothetical protein